MAEDLVDQINKAVVGFDRLYGLQLVSVSDLEARARVQVQDALKQPYGLLHGGVYASIAESLASLATAVAVAKDDCLAVGLSNSTSFLRPMTEGAVHATATRLHAGRTTWIWDVHCRDDAGRLCAVTRMTIAVRPASAQTPTGAKGATGMAS